MDPNISTREQFTQGLISVSTPDSAAEKWKKLADNLKLLLDKLAHHSAMAPNLQQTYNTPAASKNKVYFMWDFVGRTISMVYQVAPTLEGLSSKEKETWKDAQERSVYASMLIRDEMKGALDMMTEQTYPGQKGAHPEFGQEILDIAGRLGKD